MHRQDIGQVGELIVAQRLLQDGWEVFTPVSQNTRVDMIAIKEDRLIKLQVKTTTETNKHGSFPLYLRKNHAESKYDYFYEADDFDYFAVVHLPSNTLVFISTAEAMLCKHEVKFSLLRGAEKRPDNKKRFVEDYATL